MIPGIISEIVFISTVKPEVYEIRIRLVSQKKKKSLESLLPMNKTPRGFFIFLVFYNKITL